MIRSKRNIKFLTEITNFLQQSCVHDLAAAGSRREPELARIVDSADKIYAEFLFSKQNFHQKLCKVSKTRSYLLKIYRPSIPNLIKILSLFQNFLESSHFIILTNLVPPIFL